MEATFKDYRSDIPSELARRSHMGTSFYPEKRAEQELNYYQEMLESAFDKVEDFERFREGLKKRFIAYLSAKGRVMSPMITGPANFPVRRNEKANQSERNRSDDLFKYYEKATKVRGPRPIMAGDEDAVLRLEDKVIKLQAAQDRMKEANATIRKNKKNGKEGQIAALVEIGFKQQMAEDLMIENYQGVGFPSYALTNNNAKLKSAKKRLEKLVKDKAAVVEEIEGDGVNFEDNPADNRVRLFFDGKPEAEVRTTLKKNGFRWAPSIGAWQAYRNNRSISLAKSFVERIVQ